MNYSLNAVDNGWQINVEFLYKNERVRKQKTVTNCSKLTAKKTAVDFVAQLKQKAKEEHEQRNKPRSLTFLNEAIKYYISSGAGGAVSNKFYVNRIRDVLGDKRIDDIAFQFGDFLTILRRSKNRMGNPLSEFTINNYIRTARAILNSCLNGGLIPDNPLKGYKPQKVAPRKVYISEDDITRLISVTSDLAPFLLPFIAYISSVPCRKGELLKSRREYYCPFTNTITIDGSITKNGKTVVKPVPEELKGYFRAIPKECSYLFYRECNGNYKPLGDFRKHWYKIRKRAGLPKFRIHDLRHYTSTMIHNAGMSERQVMEISGWSTPMLTNYWNERGVEVAQKAESLISNSPALKLLKIG